MWKMRFAKVAVVGACAVASADAFAGMSQVMQMMQHPMAQQLLKNVDVMSLMPLMSSPEVMRIMSGDIDPSTVMALAQRPEVQKLLGGLDPVSMLRRREVREMFGGADLSKALTDPALQAAVMSGAGPEELLEAALGNSEIVKMLKKVLDMDADEIRDWLTNPKLNEVAMQIISSQKLLKRVSKIAQNPTKMWKFVALMKDPDAAQAWIDKINGKVTAKGPKELPSDASDSESEGYFKEGTDFSKLAKDADEVAGKNREL